MTVEEVQSFSNFKLAKVLKLIRQLTQSVIEPLGDFFSIPFFRSSFLFFFFSFLYFSWRISSCAESVLINDEKI
ncbi:hypothetical protein PROVRUST_07927 [Providencia rustigianii DSM 4541]|uniref:Uncharacterized protein n=2 Tax=Providencia rustigianii TaxID=158850 RepID=D1P6K3_9GAMM|nr:hypothetical protein PROVRUST_07927 [Providencia rustigianii DSM 4541]